MQKINKIVNTESLRPTTKPRLVHKSDINHEKSIQLTSQKPNYHLQDSIKETSNPQFKQYLFNHQQRDLASSFSFSEQEEMYQYEKLLFSKLLQSKTNNWMAFTRDMHKIQHSKLLDFVKIGHNDTTIHKNELISHYIGVWLLSMGYLQTETRKRIILNLRYIFPDEEGAQKIGGQLYDSLFHGYLPEALQLKILLQICKKGWEYMSFFLGKFIKLLRKFRKLSQKQFVQEVQNSI